MTDPFRHDDAAYVLGALDDAERAAFEAHLTECPACRERVAEARSTAALLAGLTASDLADVEPAPDTLLPGLLRAAARERRRRRGLVGGLAAVAAACAAALIVLVWPTGASNGSTAVAFTAIRTSAMSATAQLQDKPWGTQIVLHCHYRVGVDSYVPYQLEITDQHGQTTDAGSWTLTPGRETDFTAGTSVRQADIAKLTITLADGTPLLQITR